MKVKASPINTTAGTIFVLKTNENRVLHNAPNKWKTKRGAEKWAAENGLTIQTSAKRKTQKAATARKTVPTAVAQKCPAKKPATAKQVTRKPTATAVRKTSRKR